MLTGKQIVEEYKKCYRDKSRIYMIENYLMTFDATQKNTVAFKLFPRQKVFLNNLSKSINNITTKPRQAGISTTACAFFACELALSDPTKPENVLLIANNLDLSKENLTKIKDFIEQLPRWFFGSEYFGTPENESKPIFKKANEKYLVLQNGSRVYARSAGPNASRGCSAISRILFDEAAFIETPDTITSAISTTASSAKTVLYVSTPNGFDQIYYPVYDKALKEENDFILTQFRWYQDPRYNKNLVWTKQNKETGEITRIVEPTIDESGSIDYNEEHWADMVRSGFTPSSTWYDGMCDRYNHDKRKISQELDVSFLGSGGAVIDSEITEHHRKLYVREPIYVDNFFQEAWIFKEPIEGHRYLLTSDVATGSGDDSSVIHIIDIDAIGDNGLPCIEQVFEYQGKIQGDILGELINKYGRYYGNALAIVDCIGSSGDAAVLKLQSLGYPNLYYDDQSLKNVTTERNIDNTDDKKNPGFRIGSARLQMIMNLEKMLRFDEIIPRSKRFIQELTTFVWRNGRPDHQNGFHDDTITSMAMGLYVLQFSYRKLEAVKEKNIAILKSMIIAQNAINGVGDKIEANENVKKMPMPFYTNNTLNQAKMNNIDPNDKNKALNIYLSMQMDQFMKK